VTNGRPSKEELYGDVTPHRKLALIMHQASGGVSSTNISRPITAILNNGQRLIPVQTIRLEQNKTEAT
jgi:hypothetical protein